MKQSGSVILSWDFSNGKDSCVWLVGKQKKGKVEIVDAFQGDNATDIYRKLIATRPKPQKTSFFKKKEIKANEDVQSAT